MADSYTELKELPELRGSLNLVVSEIHRLKRPPSLSESHAWTPNNVERAFTLASPRVFTIESYSPQADAVSDVGTDVGTDAVSDVGTVTLPCAFQHILLISFLFHIMLISVFETLFFFFYVSTLEDVGIIKTVSGFTKSLVDDCEQLTLDEKGVVNWILTSLVNASVIEARGAAAAASRSAVNHRLLLLSWYYVVGIVACFGVAAVAGLYRRLPIPWRRLCLENCGLVLLLGVFEGAFFTTIVYPYLPLSGPEIAASTVEELQNSCGLLRPALMSQ
jgi:hypothetical protein